MKRILLGLIVVLLLAGAGLGGYYYRQTEIDKLSNQKTEIQTRLDSANDVLAKQPKYEYQSAGKVPIIIFNPQSESRVTDPIVVMGMVPGNWSFEAQFPVELKDADGKRIAQVSAKVIGDWMTTDMRPFTATLDPEVKLSGNGSLVLHKANPSGLPANDDSLTIPIKF